MKYNKFTIKNFKGIEELTLDLNQTPAINIFTLVGLNESGKTTILEAIDLFQNPIREDYSHRIIPKKLKHDFKGQIEITAELELVGNDIDKISKIFQNIFNHPLTDITNNIITISRVYVFPTAKKMKYASDERYWGFEMYGIINGERKNLDAEFLANFNENYLVNFFKEVFKNFVPKIIYFPDFLFSFPHRIYLDDYKEININQSEKIMQIEYRNIISDMLTKIDKNNNIDIEKLLYKMKNSEINSNSDSLNSLLAKMSNLMNREILDAWNKNMGISPQGKIHINQKSESRGPRDIAQDENLSETRYCLEIVIEHNSDVYYIDERSLGFRWFFSFLLFIHFRKSRLTDPGETLFLLDEPASNLHQSAQKKILELLRKIATDCKLIYSTHSHHLIDPKLIAGTYVVTNKAIDYKDTQKLILQPTEITAKLYRHFMSTHKNQQDSYQPILDALGYQPSHLELVPNIVFTEGLSDFYILKYFMEIVFENKYVFSIYPGAGASKQGYVIGLYTAWCKPFVCLLDADIGGIRAKKKYIKQVGEQLGENVFTYEDICKKWKKYKIEDLFSTDDEKLEIIQKAFRPDDLSSAQSSVTYEKSNFGHAFSYLYHSNKLIEINDETKEKFEFIIKFLNDKLEKQKSISG